MRTVLHLTAMRSTKYGALEKYFVRLARACRDRGVRSVFQYEEAPRSDRYLADLRAEDAEVCARRIAGQDPRSVLRLLRTVARFRPEILHAHFVTGITMTLVPWLRRLAGARATLLTLHTDPQLSGSSAAIAVRRANIRLACNAYDRVLAVSGGVRNRLLDYGVEPGKVEVLYLGLVQPPEPSPRLRAQHRRELGIPETSPAFACIAFETPFKGLDVLLQAFRRVIADPEPHLIVIGVDPDRSALPRMADRLGVGGRVHWAGIRDDGCELLHAADVYVQPSRFGEGLSLSCTEAMSLGLPVVASRVCGMDEVVVEGETGFLAEPGSVDGLAVELQRALDSRARREALGAAARRRFDERFDGNRSIRTLLDRHYGLAAAAPAVGAAGAGASP